MHDLTRVEDALARKDLSPKDFERYAQDLLTEVYPGLTPKPGGTDWGRDGDIVIAGEDVPARLLVTSSRSLNGVRKNMQGGIKSLREHQVPVNRIVLANPAVLSNLDQQKLVSAADGAGVRLDAADIFGGGWFASKLRRDGHWRKKLLGLASGPVTLASIPADLAQSPWRDIPLVARQSDVDAVRDDRDLILTGPPGIGKTRLLTELDNVAFVDKDADFGQVTDDLRSMLPAVVVVDDAADHDQLVRRLWNLRASESDLFTFRLVVVCWPHDLDKAKANLPNTRPHELGPVERVSLDKLVEGMGVTGQLVRGEILDQAEGRPGWAVALAALCLGSGGAASLLNGRALLGEVDRYLRRAGIHDVGVDVLAVIAALGETTSVDLPPLATAVGVEHHKFKGVLDAVARGGLVDITQRPADTPTSTTTVYRVSPPILGAVLVTERLFITPSPLASLDELVQQWPRRIDRLAGAAIDAAALGAQSARRPAQVLMDKALSSPDVLNATKFDLRARFLQLDEPAARHIWPTVREHFNGTIIARSDGPEVVRADAIYAESVGLAALIADRWQYQDAIHLLLDASVPDLHLSPPALDSPLKRIDELLIEFHPEVLHNDGLRHAVVSALHVWTQAAPHDPDRQEVAARVMRNLLSVRLRSETVDPGSHAILQISETVLPPDGIRRVFKEVWPVAVQMLDDGNQHLVPIVVEAAERWLDVGGGEDHLDGQPHSADQVNAAKAIGTTALAAILARDDVSLGHRVRLGSAAERQDLPVDIRMPDDLEPFFRAIRYDTGGWEQAQLAVTHDLRRIALAWADHDPAAAVRRLADLQTEVEIAQQMMDLDRVETACIALADHVADPVAWLDACRAANLMPAGCAFADRALREGHLTNQHVDGLLANPAARAHVLSLLIAPKSPDWAITKVAAALTAQDHAWIETAALRQELAQTQITTLLTEPVDGRVRATVALALFSGSSHGNSQWPPPDVEEIWLAAFQEMSLIDFSDAPGNPKKFIQFLVTRYPHVFTSLVQCHLVPEPYLSLPLAVSDSLHRLPAACKTIIWDGLAGRPMNRRLLGQLVGADIGWLRRLLEAEEVTAEEVLRYFCDAFRLRPSVEDLAKLLVPRGVEPAKIAKMRLSGIWWGEESAHYESILDEYQQMFDTTTDPSIRAVASAGLRIFASARDKAVATEQQKRITGDTW